MCRDIGRSVDMDEKGTQKTSDKIVVISRKVAYKNILVIGFAQLLVHAATNPTNALVTSTAGKTLGNITFCLNHIFSCLFSFYTISIFDKQTSKKRVLLFGTVCTAGFVACNWYVSYYSMIPGTALFGAGMSSSWIITLLYVKKLSINYTTRYSLNEKHITSFFAGIVMGLSLAGYVLGNATASGVLTLLKSKGNQSLSVSFEEINLTNDNGLKECRSNDDQLEFDSVTMNALRGLLLFYALLGFIIPLFFLDDLENKNSSFQITLQLKSVITNLVKNIWLNLKIVTKLSITKEMIISMPLFITIGSSSTFAFTRYTKVSASSSVCILLVSALKVK